MKPKPTFCYPILEILQKRWSPRSFSDKSIDQNDLMSLFEAARWAASANNEQPWRFIYATKSEIEKYEKLLSCLVEANRIWAKTAPVLIVALVKTHFERNNIKNEWAKHDLGLAIGNLTAQASSLDIFVHNMAGFSKDTIREYFNVPREYQPITMIAIGYIGNPDVLPEKLRDREDALQQRKPLNEIFI